MPPSLHRIWQAAPVATVILGVALAASLFFAVRLAAFWIYWADPAHRDQEIQPWMTPGYVAHSWDIPREVMVEALGPPSRDGRRRSLEEIAQDRGESVADLAAAIRAAIAAHRDREGQP